MDVHGSRAARECDPPHAVEQLRAAHHDPRPRREMPEEVELAARELDLCVRDPSGAGPAIELDVSRGEPVIGLVGLHSPEHRAYPCGELTRRERLRDVVVRPELEPGHAIDLLVARREHHHRQGRGRADRPADVEPVRVGQLEIEDRETDVVALELGQPLGPAGRPDDAEPVPLQVGADEGGDVLLVLDEQDRAARRH